MGTIPEQEPETSGTLLSVLKTGGTKYGNTWACVGVADSAGHTKPALVPNEDFPVADVEHWMGLKLKLELRGPDKLWVMPLAKQPSESIAEATARKQGEETMSDPVTQDHPVDGMTEFKLHRNEKNIEMVNAHNWRQDGRMMRF